MAEHAGEKLIKSPSEPVRPRLRTIPVSIRLPEDIVKELPYIAVYNHKTSTADIMREWIVKAAATDINKASYQKFKTQIREAVQR